MKSLIQCRFDTQHFLTEEAEEARNIAGRRPALFAADEDDEVKKFFRAAPAAPRSTPRQSTSRQSLLFLLSSCSKADVESRNLDAQEARQW